MGIARPLSWPWSRFWYSRLRQKLLLWLGEKEHLPEILVVPRLETREQVELCEFLVESHRQHIAQFRSVEWQTVFQTYAGYVAIATAYWTFVGREYDASAIESFALLSSVLLSALLYCRTRFLFINLQNRMHFEQRGLRMRMEQLRTCEMAAGLFLDEREDGKGPKNRGWYAYEVQICLSTTIFVLLIVYFVLSLLDGLGALATVPGTGDARWEFFS